VIGCVGRLAEVKGQDRLIEAFAAAFAGEPGVVLQLVGDGPSRESLEALVQRLGLAGRVVFMGFRADARALMGAMDLVVLPSRSEGLSVALLEAMAEGVPVAATAVGDNACVLDEGRCGILLPVDETRWPEALAAVVKELRADEGVWRERVDAARARVRDVYSLERTVKAYESLYAGSEAERHDERT
jgi:glycosyltransferase involved in cell wall biosynthesis